MDKFKYWSYVEGNDFTTNYDTKGLHIKGKDLTALLGIRVLFQTEFLKIPLMTKDVLIYAQALEIGSDPLESLSPPMDC